ncbi:hypothetical protein MMC15_006740 [Xylographa vitiligo]|nr:hypothetical protein [Xylographa vitiligo]
MSQSAQGLGGLMSLPNELLITILAPFPSEMLLPLATISHRLHSIIVRIIHTRLLLAASLKDTTLILESYHPSSRNTEPYFFCDYLGTPGLSSVKEGTGMAYGDNSHVGDLGKLGELYSRFRPIKPEVEYRLFHSHDPGDIPRHRGTSTLLSNQRDVSSSGSETLVSHLLNLDSHELFSQLCVVTNLVQLGPRRGIFYAFVNVADGVIRVWREWLAQRGEVDGEKAGEAPHRFTGELDSPEEQRKVSAIVEEVDAGARTLWVDNHKNVGIRVRIKQRIWRDVPVILHSDEDPAVSYDMTYEELLVRTTHLLLALERMLSEQNNASSKAMIFGSFASHNEA